MKSWTYDEITAQTEIKIKDLLRLSESASTPYGKNMHAEWAYGVYSGWCFLTLGWQKPGDDDRLKALAEGKAQDQ